MSADRQTFLAEAKGKATSDPIKISVRDLLAYWNAQRRGYWIVEQIRESLKSEGLKTEPPFVDVWIGASVKIVPLTPKENSPSKSAKETKSQAQVVQPEVYLRVGSLQSANSGVTHVNPQHDIQTAQSLMLRHGYSQLAVLSGERDLRGAVSWESIAQARIRSADTALADVTVPAEVVLENDDLLAQIPRIISAGFVFVKAKDQRISGIVTTADLSKEFAQTANPFFILGEIEKRLRSIIDEVFSPEELAEMVDPDDSTRTVSKADHLTFGEYIRLLENPTRWGRLDWQLDRKVFIEALHEVREIRNDIMHFSPDPLDDDGVAKLRNFAQWLRKIM